jgi:hypothetical protein
MDKELWKKLRPEGKGILFVLETPDDGKSPKTQFV